MSITLTDEAAQHVYRAAMEDPAPFSEITMWSTCADSRVGAYSARWPHTITSRCCEVIQVDELHYLYAGTAGRGRPMTLPTSGRTAFVVAIGHANSRGLNGK